MKKVKYQIELVEKYDGTHYPNHILLSAVYFNIEDAKAFCNNYRANNPDSNYFPTIMSKGTVEDDDGMMLDITYAVGDKYNINGDEPVYNKVMTKGEYKEFQWRRDIIIKNVKKWENE